MGMLVAACIVQLLSTQYEEIAPSEILGRYHEGGAHTSWTIDLRQDYTFERRSSSCLTRDQVEGTWAIQGDVIVLNAFDKEGKSNARYVPIRFDHHLYFIAENRVPAFANEARKGIRAVPPLSRHPIKFDGKGEFIVSDKATWFPSRYRPYFEFGPINAKVIRMVDRQRVEVDLTAKFAIQPKTRLGVHGRATIELEIESVTGTKGIARVWYSEDADRRVEIGDEFDSTCYVAPESAKRFADLDRKRKP